MRPCIVLLSLAALAAPACTRLPGSDNAAAQQFAVLADIPAAYGQLVTVTLAQPGSDTRWRELWFENHDTGVVTYVPVLVPDWKYLPDSVKTFKRP